MKSNCVDQWNRLTKNVWEKYVLEDKGTRKIIRILIVFFVGEVVAFFADLCPADYWFDWLERAFEYNTANVIPVVAIVWGVVSVPIGFLLQQIENRNYGIRLIDFLIASLGKGNSVFLIGSFWFQLVLIVYSSAYNRPILFTVVTWTQLIYVFCFFYLVMLSISHEAIDNVIRRQSREICKGLKEKNDNLENEIENKRIKEQVKILMNYRDTEEMRHWLLLDMIKNIDYNRFEDVENLKKILVEDVCPKLKGFLGRKTTYDLFKIMLSVAEKEVMKQIASDVFSAKVGVDSRKGILAALISERTPDFYQLCNNLIRKLEDSCMDKDDKERIFIWTILWGMHQKTFSMNLMEKMCNDVFIESIQKIIKENGICFVSHEKEIFNDTVIQSCKDVALLMNVETIDEVIVNLFKYKLTF